MLNYIIITPVKNEEMYIKYTLDSVASQTLKPLRWIIVNDSSTDKTEQIIKSYVEKHNWIHLLNIYSLNPKRAEGSKIVELFYVGYNTIKDSDYDFIVKLDGDLTLPSQYFKTVAKSFKSDRRVGMCGGYCAVKKNGKIVKEKSSDYHLRGAIKAYRKECFDDIGGIKKTFGWDGIDEMTAMYKGWKVKVLNLEVIHHRPTTHVYNKSSLSFQRGCINYKKGSSFLLIIVRTLVRVYKRPFIWGGVFFITGYFYAFLSREEKILERDLQKFINQYHYRRLLKIRR